MIAPFPHPRALLACAALVLGGGLAAAPAGTQAPAGAPAAGYKETIPNTAVSFEMVPVPGGQVTVEGTPVTVAPFLIGRTEVTWDLYDVFALARDTTEPPGVDAIARPSRPYGAPDHNWGHNGYPVISVTRDAAEAFCAWLSAVTGRKYRLPTEAEWVRAADLAAAAGRPDAIAWHAGNARGTTHPVAKRTPDALGLFDLFGNAAEWVATADGQPVTRGGSFRDPLEAMSPSARAPYHPSWQERDPQLPKSTWWLSDGPFVGFRLATSGP